jgi:hypothetical protein
MDRLLIQNSLLTTPSEIKEQLKLHFENYFQEIPSPPITSTQFSNLYQPISNDNSIYKNLLTEISELEYNEVIKQLPNKKAAGPSELNYEHIKHLGSKGHIVLRNFLSQCLSTQIIPTDWKTSNIFLIPKKSVWDYTLDQVRPISLIEPIKKCLTKIFTNRLDQIITQNNLLSNLNFAATKNSSTHTPIQILHNTIEYYKNTNQEAWILFQDMSKAFDKININ